MPTNIKYMKMKTILFKGIINLLFFKNKNVYESITFKIF